jgi:hypothetical protein
MRNRGSSDSIRERKIERKKRRRRRKKPGWKNPA